MTDGLDRDGLWWLSGYAAALARARQRPAVQPSAWAPARLVAALCITVVFGSQTGNARCAAERLVAALSQAGAEVRLQNAADYPLRELKSEMLLVVVISTQVDGNPPDDSLAFVEHVLGPRAPRLDGPRSLAAPGQTLVFYMGVSATGSVGTRPVARGLPADTPISIVENGSLPSQRVITGSLGRLGHLVREQTVSSPALLIVGDVAALAGRLHWFGDPPVADVAPTAALRRAA